MVSLNESQEAPFRWAARLLAVLASGVFALLAISQGPPVPPEGPGIERDIQYVFVLIGIVATALAWRWYLPGGTLMFLTGVVLGIAASMRYSEQTALFVALGYAIPGVLFLALWSLRQNVMVQLVSVALVVALMAYGGIDARARHERAFGPAHPASVLTEQPSDKVEWVWSGGVSATGATVNARIADGGARARLVAGADPAFASPIFSDYQEVRGDTNRVVSLRLDGLDPGTNYYYAVEVDGVRDELRMGRFETFPTGASSFSVVVASCARTGSNGAVFDAIRGENALLYIIAGDFHYENIVTGSLSKFRSAYQKVLTSPAQAALYQQTPIAYVWDDHDFGGSNSNSTSVAREAVQVAYRENVPHYALPGGSTDGPVYQSFSVGRVRFVMTDTRSERDAERMPGGGESVLGSVQREWLKQELGSASQTHELVVWVNAVPWIASGGGDHWGGYPEERADIADFIAANGIRNLLMLSGDAHMLAIDDGSNTDYSKSGGASFPLMQAGALDRPGSIKGGPYSEGAFPGAGQYGLVTVHDDGSSMRVQLSGRNWRGDEIVAYAFTLSGGQMGVAGGR